MDTSLLPGSNPTAVIKVTNKNYLGCLSWIWSDFYGKSWSTPSNDNCMWSAQPILMYTHLWYVTFQLSLKRIGSFYFSEVLLRNNLVNMALSTMTRTCMTYTKQENQTHYLQGKIWQSATQMKQYLTNETYHMRMKMQGTHTFTLTGLLKTESEKRSTRCMCKHTLAHEFFT